MYVVIYLYDYPLYACLKYITILYLHVMSEQGPILYLFRTPYSFLWPRIEHWVLVLKNLDYIIGLQLGVFDIYKISIYEYTFDISNQPDIIESSNIDTFRPIWKNLIYLLQNEKYLIGKTMSIIYREVSIQHCDISYRKIYRYVMYMRIPTSNY